MKIWVDADACPAAIKEILYRAANRAQVELTLEQYASLCVELRTHRGREIQTLLRYRLGAPRKAALDLQWREHFERSPGLRMAFTAACERYAAFLTGGKVASC